jgi:hypothetical protein
MRVIGRNLPNGIVRYQGECAVRERENRMVHLLQHKTVQVDEITGHVNGIDLPVTLDIDLVSSGEALHQHDADPRPVTLPD